MAGFTAVNSDVSSITERRSKQGKQVKSPKHESYIPRKPLLEEHLGLEPSHSRYSDPHPFDCVGNEDIYAAMLIEQRDDRHRENASVKAMTISRTLFRGVAKRAATLRVTEPSTIPSILSSRVRDLVRIMFETKSRSLISMLHPRYYLPASTSSLKHCLMMYFSTRKLSWTASAISSHPQTSRCLMTSICLKLLLLPIKRLHLA